MLFFLEKMFYNTMYLRIIRNNIVKTYTKLNFLRKKNKTAIDITL